MIHITPVHTPFAFKNLVRSRRNFITTEYRAAIATIAALRSLDGAIGVCPSSRLLLGCVLRLVLPGFFTDPLVSRLSLVRFACHKFSGH